MIDDYPKFALGLHNHLIIKQIAVNNMESINFSRLAVCLTKN